MSKNTEIVSNLFHRSKKIVYLTKLKVTNYSCHQTCWIFDGISTCVARNRFRQDMDSF